MDIPPTSHKKNQTLTRLTRVKKKSCFIATATDTSAVDH